jgi:hypothetical protein
LAEANTPDRNSGHQQQHIITRGFIFRVELHGELQATQLMEGSEQIQTKSNWAGLNKVTVSGTISTT